MQNGDTYGDPLQPIEERCVTHDGNTNAPNLFSVTVNPRTIRNDEGQICAGGGDAHVCATQAKNV